jgi:hypothetical protein
MRNPTLLALPSEGEEGVAIRGECLSMGSDKDWSRKSRPSKATKAMKVERQDRAGTAIKFIITGYQVILRKRVTKVALLYPWKSKTSDEE